MAYLGFHSLGDRLRSCGELHRALLDLFGGRQLSRGLLGGGRRHLCLCESRESLRLECNRWRRDRGTG